MGHPTRGLPGTFSQEHSGLEWYAQVGLSCRKPPLSPWGQSCMEAARKLHRRRGWSGEGSGRCGTLSPEPGCVRNTVSHMHRAQAKKRRSWELTGARHCSQQVHTMRELGLQLHFTDAETENQRWQVTCLWSHSEPVPQSFNLGSLIPGSDIAMGAPDVGSEAMNPPRSS